MLRVCSHKKVRFSRLAGEEELLDRVGEGDGGVGKRVDGAERVGPKRPFVGRPGRLECIGWLGRRGVDLAEHGHSCGDDGVERLRIGPFGFVAG